MTTTPGEAAGCSCGELTDAKKSRALHGSLCIAEPQKGGSTRARPGGVELGAGRSVNSDIAEWLFASLDGGSARQTTG